MFRSRPITLVLPPSQPVVAKIVPLTPELADAHLMGAWWRDDSLKESFSNEPIDRYWDWNEFTIEDRGRPLPSERIAVVTGEAADLAVQGAMMISTELIESVLEPGERCLLLELLFTAPR